MSLNEVTNLFSSFLSGLSVLYFMVLVFLLFQNRQDVRLMVEWIFPDLKGVAPEDKVTSRNEGFHFTNK